MAHRLKSKPFFPHLSFLALISLLLIIASLVSISPALALTREGSIPAQGVPNSGAPYVAENEKWAILVGRNGADMEMAVIDKENKSPYRYVDHNAFTWGWLRDAKGVVYNNDRILVWVVNIGSDTAIAVVDYWPITAPGATAQYTTYVSGQPNTAYIPWAYAHGSRVYGWVITDLGKLYVVSTAPSNMGISVDYTKDISVAQSTTSIYGWWDSAVSRHVVAIRKDNGDWHIVYYQSESKVWIDLATIPGVNADPYYSLLYMFTDSNDNSKRIYLWGYIQPFLEGTTRKYRVGVVKVIVDINTLESAGYSHDYTVINADLPGGDTPAWGWPDFISPNYFSFLIPGYNSVDLYTYVSRVVVAISNGYGSDPVSINVAGSTTAEEYGFNQLSYTSSVYINPKNGWVWEYNNGYWYAYTGAQEFSLPTVYSIEFLTQEIYIPGQAVEIEVNATGGPLTVITKYYVNGIFSAQWVYIGEFADPWEAIILPNVHHDPNHLGATVEFIVEVHYSGIILATASKTYTVYPVDIVVLWLDYTVDNYVYVNFTLMLWETYREAPYWGFLNLTLEIYDYYFTDMLIDSYEFQEWDYNTEDHTYFTQIALNPGYYYAKFIFTDPYSGLEKVYVSDMFKVYSETGEIPPPPSQNPTATGPYMGGWGFGDIGDALSFMVMLIPVLVLILGPALILSKEAGLKAIGFYAGALIGLIVATAVGLIPWYLSIFGIIGLLLLMWWGK